MAVPFRAGETWAALARLTREERKDLVGSLRVMHGRKLKREAEADTAKKGATE